MRLSEIDRGDSLGNRLLIGMISTLSGMRLPDAARVAFYHKAFFGAPLGAWTQATMRGPSDWTVSERELMAALVARWNNCAFCVGAHGAIAAKEMTKPTVAAALDDFRTAPISEPLKAALAYIERLTRTPDQVTAYHARAALQAGLTLAALSDAVAVSSIFAIITRYADALAFVVPSERDFDRAADMLLKRGYGG